MNQTLLTKLSLRFSLESGVRLRQSTKFIENKLKEDTLQVINESLQDTQVLSGVYLLVTDHPYKFKIKGRKTPHILHNIQYALHLVENQKYNILVTKCDKGIMNLLTYELA